MADTLETLEIEVKHKASGVADEIDQVANSIRGLSDALKGIPQVGAKVRTAATQSAKGIKEVSESAKKAQTPLSTFVSSLKRIAFYRFIRGIIKSITQAFQEGLQWAYQFSAGISGEGNRFAQAMDRIKSSGSQMKAQLGSAFIGLLTAIEPIIQRIVNLIIKLADIISQFFAAFTGTTYLKAQSIATQFADTMKSGGAAAKEWKNQLLGFDEINRLNEPSGGGGGGGASGLDPSQMFEDTPLDKWAMKLREIINWVKEHLDLVKGIAEAIGIAILGWKIGNFLAGLTGLTPILQTVLGLALAIGGAFLFIKGATDAWTNGVDWDNLAMMIGGVAAVAIGLGIAFGAVAAAVSLLIGGIAMLVIGIRDWIKQGELSEQTFWLLEAAIIAVSVALGILIGWPAALIGAFVGALGVIIYYWDAIIGRIATAIQALKDFLSLDSINKRAEQSWNDGSVFLTGFASGGYPEPGQLFIANEYSAGAELVGNIGGRTGVASNNDILEGIRQGVYDAVLAANGNGNNDVNVKVFLDSKEIKAGQQRLARAWG